MISKKIKRFGLLFSVLLLSFSVIPSQLVYGADTDDETCSIKSLKGDTCLDYFYSNNDILYYNPRAQNCSNEETSADLSSDNNAENILRYFVSKGLSLAAAAGFAGNMKQESGLNPKIIQGGRTAPSDYKPVSGVGFGLVQWTFGGTTSSRQGGLYKLSQSKNKKITSLELQLDYAWKELSGPYKQSTLNKLKNISDPVTAAIIVHDNYEISADSAATVRSVRGGNAKSYYNSFKDKITDSSVVFTGDTTNDDGCVTQDTGGLGISGNFTFPLKTTKAVIKKGVNGAKWCADKTTNCHHSSNAADIFVPTGTPIVAVKSGRVVSANPPSGSCYSRSVGCNLAFISDDGVLYYYAHMNKHATVKPGQKVTAGQVVGAVGDDKSAMSTTRHLHIDALPASKYKARPSCTYASCSGYPFINIQKNLHDAYQKLPA